MTKSKTNGGTKYDTGKLRFDLVPSEALEAVVEVWTYGANKYADRDWEKGLAWGRIFAALMRHMWAFWRGESLDEESGLPHLAHAAWCTLALLQYYLMKIGTDDRPGTVRIGSA